MIQAKLNEFSALSTDSMNTQAINLINRRKLIDFDGYDTIEP